MYKTNKALYGIILIISVLFVALSLRFKAQSEIFTILSAIGCGSITSTVVAWLIDSSNCRLAKKRMLLNREILLNEIFLEIKSGIDLFAIQCVRLKNMNDYKLKQSWFKWIEMAFVALQNDREEIVIFCNTFRAFAEKILYKTKVLEAQKMILLDQEMLTKEDINALNGMINVFNLTEYMFWNPSTTYEEISRTCFENAKILFNIIEASPALSEINKKEIGSTLLDKLEESGVDLERYRTCVTQDIPYER